MKKALVLGLGLSGKSASSFLKKRGYEVVEVDDKLAPAKIDDFSAFSLLVPSPGIPPVHPLYQKTVAAGVEVVSEVELALRQLSNPCIGVTGTNGKSTVVKMIEHILSACGKPAKAVGNIGEPLSSYVDHQNEEEVLVLELSSYQLYTPLSKKLDVALILNITEDHLDWHGSFDEYAKAKLQIQQSLKESAPLIVFEKVAEQFLLSCETFGGDDPNREAATLAVSHFGIERAQAELAMISFVSLPHRLEHVATIDGVEYYNDSKATNVAATLQALSQMEKSVVLLLGGEDKGLNFLPLAGCKEKMSHVIAFGEAGPKIASVFSGKLSVSTTPTLEEAIKQARKIATDQEVVLFSPGSSSFDAFENFEKRGEFFREKISKLQYPESSDRLRI